MNNYSENLIGIDCNFGCTHYISEDTAWSLLCGAFEGGSNYWIDQCRIPDTMQARRAKTLGIPYSHDTSKLNYCIASQSWRYIHQIPFLTNGHLFIKADGVEYMLDRNALIQGIEGIADMDNKRHLHDLISESGDAITSDLFLQFALFGEVVYG